MYPASVGVVATKLNAISEDSEAMDDPWMASAKRVKTIKANRKRHGVMSENTRLFVAPSPPLAL